MSPVRGIRDNDMQRIVLGTKESNKWSLIPKDNFSMSFHSLSSNLLSWGKANSRP